MARALVVALIVSTAVHYTDNWLRVERYAPREGLLADNPWLIPIAWGLFALLGIAAYREYRRGPTLRAHLMLAGFSVAGISSFGHLFYEGNDFAAYQWLFVLSDGIIGAAVLAFALWSAARARTGPEPSITL
jgi:tryptophan-rich sensory protein